MSRGIMISIGTLMFRIRNKVFPLALLLILIPGPPVFEGPFTAAAVGLAIALLGQTIRAVTIGLTYIIRGGRNRQVYAEGLVTEGIYAHCRNPMYVGNLLIATGVALTANTWSCLVLAVGLFGLFYLAIASAEEDYLARRFGAAYRHYCDEVPRFVPRLSGLLHTVRSSSFHWRRVLAKEYGTLVAWPLRWMIVVVFTLWRDGRLAARTEVISGMSAVALLFVAGYMALRILKKRRILVAD